MLKYYLYRHIRNDNTLPFYIGIGTKPKTYNGLRTEYKRAYDASQTKRGDHWLKIYNKLNGNITVEILYESNNYNEIKSKEIEFISLYKRKDTHNGLLVNHTNGGEGVSGKIVSEQTKLLISLKNKGRKISKETRDKIIKNHASKKEGYIKIMSDESRNKISKSLTGIYLKKHVYCIETGTKYESIRELCNSMFNGEGANKIISCLSDKYPNISYRGFHFSYSETDRQINNPSYFKKIMCLENNKQYNNIAECSLDLFGDKKYKSSVSRAVKKSTSYKQYNFKEI